MPSILSTITWRIFTFHLKAHCTDFNAKHEWPPNSPDLHALDCCVWSKMLQAFHKLNPKLKTGAKKCTVALYADM